jgi:predicted ribosome quality control (RQC) complex YloA/Tae2 family protein
MKPREITLSDGTKILLGKNAENNDELVKGFKGKSNIILHTVKPGSPFCIILNENPTEKEIKEAAIFCASKSQDYRDNQKDVELHIFTGKDVKKPIFAKSGTWKLTKKPRVLKVKKIEIDKTLKK